MSDSAFLTTDLSQDTTEPIIPLLFSFLLVELKLILMGMTAEVMYSKSWTDQPFLADCPMSSPASVYRRACPRVKMLSSLKINEGRVQTTLGSKMYMLRKTLKVCRVFFFLLLLLFEDLIKFLIPIISLKEFTLPHLSRTVLMTRMTYDTAHSVACTHLRGVTI